MWWGWGLLLILPPFFFLFEASSFGVSLPVDLSEWSNENGIFYLFRIFVILFMIFTVGDSLLILIQHYLNLPRRMFCETQKQTFLSIGMLILFLLFVLCLAFTGTTTTQEEETVSQKSWSGIITLAFLSGFYHWTIFLQLYFFLYPHYIKAQQQVRFCEKVRIIYNDALDNPRVCFPSFEKKLLENAPHSHSTGISPHIPQCKSFVLAQELSRNKIFDGYEVQLTSMRDFNPMGLVGSGGDTRVLDGGDDQSGICLLLFVLDQSQASFENGVCQWLQHETNSRINEGKYFGHRENIVYLPAGHRRIDLGRLKYSVFGLNSSSAPSSSSDEPIFINDWLDDIGLFSLTRNSPGSLNWPSFESDEDRQERFEEWVILLEQSMKSLVLNPKATCSLPENESDPYLSGGGDFLFWITVPPNDKGRETVKLRNRPHEKDVHGHHLLLFALFSSYRWFYIRYLYSRCQSHCNDFVGPIIGLPRQLIYSFLFFVIVVLFINVLDHFGVIFFPFDKSVVLFGIPLGLQFGFRVFLSLLVPIVYSILAELEEQGFFCEHCQDHSHEHDHESEPGEKADQIDTLAQDATFYPTIAPLPLSLSPYREGKLDLEKEGELLWPSQEDVEQVLNERYVNLTYCYQPKANVGFSRFYTHEITLRDFHDKSLGWVKDPATEAVYFFASSFSSQLPDEGNGKEEETDEDMTRNVDYVMSKLEPGRKISPELRRLLPWKIWRRFLQAPIFTSLELEDQIKNRWEQVVVDVKKGIKENGLIIMPNDFFPPIIISALQDAFFRVLDRFGGISGLGAVQTWNEEPIGRYLNHQLTPFMRKISGEQILHPGLSLAIWNGPGEGFIFHTDTIPPFDITLDIMVFNQGPVVRPIHFLVRDKSNRLIPRVEKIELHKPGSSALFIGSHLPHFGGDLPEGCTQAVLLLTWSFLKD